MSWTVACCEDCWNKHYRPESSDPVRLVAHHRDIENCGHCGNETVSGIYIRLDPKEQHPNAARS